MVLCDFTGFVYCTEMIFRSIKPVVSLAALLAVYNVHDDRSSKSDGSTKYQSKSSEWIKQIQTEVGVYERIDEKLDSLMQYSTDHAVHDTLMGDSMIEMHEVYRKLGHDEICCLFKFGKSVNGYPGVVHGGITALLMDNSYGWLFMALNLPPAVTANLNINYRAPIYAGSRSILRAKVDRIEGRKLLMSCTVEDAETGKLQAESTTIFVTIAKS